MKDIIILTCMIQVFNWKTCRLHLKAILQSVEDWNLEAQYKKIMLRQIGPRFQCKAVCWGVTVE